MIKQLPINWGNYILIAVTTYSVLRDCYIHIFPTYQILFTCIFLSLLPMLVYK
jgi:hypothetical protein